MLKAAFITLSSLVLCVPAQCEDSIKPSIIGGNDTLDDAYPWMVALLRIDDERTATERQFCGGVLIAPNWILTAAHCVEGSPPREFEIMVGNSDLAADYLPVLPRSIHIHPAFHSRRINRGCDLALINIDDTFDDIAPVPINRAMAILQPGRSASALGWGNTSLSAYNKPSKLQEVSLLLSEINAAYESDHTIRSYFIPTEIPDSTKGTYSGDSGGPLVMKSEDSDEWRLVGLTSFGSRSPSLTTNLSYFTNVAVAYDWIESVITLPTPPKIPVLQRILPNIKRDNETFVGYRIWPFASIRTEKLSFNRLDHRSPTPVQFHLSFTDNYIPVGDGSFYMLDRITQNSNLLRSQPSSFADIEIDPAATRDYPLYRAAPFQTISFRHIPEPNTYFDTYRGAIELKNLLPNTNYQIAKDGYVDVEIIELDPIDQQARHLGNVQFLTVAGRSYFLNISNTYNSRSISVIPLSETTVTPESPYQNQLTENSQTFRSSGTRIELAKIPYTSNSKKTVISILPEFDAELFYFNESGILVGYADQGAENETDELIVASNYISNSQIGISNFDAYATGSFTLSLKPYVDQPLKWGEMQVRAITTADESWTDSRGSLNRYEDLTITNTNNYSFMTVRLRGRFFEPGLGIYDSDYKNIEFESGSSNYQTTIEIEPGEKYYLDVINYSGTWAENYEITVEGSNTDPR